MAQEPIRMQKLRAMGKNPTTSAGSPKVGYNKGGGVFLGQNNGYRKGGSAKSCPPSSRKTNC